MSGCIQIYCGEGKGKTTAAMGLALRMLGRGGHVVIVQFLKSRASGEILMLEQMNNVTVLRGKSGGFSFGMTQEERLCTARMHDENLRRAMELPCELLILDEAAAAYEKGLVDRLLLDACIANKPAHMELVLTGRRPPQHWLDQADYITEMTLRKHPYTEGLAAREGIEY